MLSRSSNVNTTWSSPQKDGIHGLLELAVNKEHHDIFSSDAFQALAESIADQEVEVATLACTAAWMLSSTTSCRRSVVNYGGAENVFHSLRRFDKEDDENMQPFLEEAGLGALALFFLDRDGRAGYFEVDPGAKLLVDLSTKVSADKKQ